MQSKLKGLLLSLLLVLFLVPCSSNVEFSCLLALIGHSGTAILTLPPSAGESGLGVGGGAQGQRWRLRAEFTLKLQPSQIPRALSGTQQNLVSCLCMKPHMIFFGINSSTGCFMEHIAQIWALSAHLIYCKRIHASITALSLNQFSPANQSLFSQMRR